MTVEVKYQALDNALKRLDNDARNPAPLFALLVEEMAERIKKRFETSTDPAGHPWHPLAQATYEALARRLGKSNFGKDGRLNAKGAQKIAGKKILIGETGDLSRQIFTHSDDTGGTVATSVIYAAIHQFGGQAGRNHKVTIPARPFFPITPDGNLYPEEVPHILDTINWYFSQSLKN